MVSLGLDRFSGIYVWVAIIVLFALWIPDTFLTEGNLRIIAGDQAITAILAIGLIVPLAAGVFDLSIAGVMGFSVAMVSYQLSLGISATVAILTTLLCGALIGAVNGFVVVRLKVDSFIATLGMSSIMLAGTYWVTDGKQITEGFTDGFLGLGSGMFLGLPLPFYYMVVVAAVMYVLLEKTPLGRYLYATGGNRQAARLAGLRVERIMFGSLVTSATVAALAGVVLAAKLGTAAPDIGRRTCCRRSRRSSWARHRYGRDESTCWAPSSPSTCWPPGSRDSSSRARRASSMTSSTASPSSSRSRWPPVRHDVRDERSLPPSAAAADPHRPRGHRERKPSENQVLGADDDRGGRRRCRRHRLLECRRWGFG
ncbi:ABC transporter permease [Gordonia sp. SMJS1]|uniref:ABC transporter permease n=1 Tax=Gordonia sp. SMJS1 TaxID=3039400 RepID=UPI00245504D3|nr:ABC transporter permease [Gordonia sp. SMJS1]WGJ84737.1 ABC transporter permease [Gordonia sp. SMJS1]